jgi:hypothetical protein
MLPDHEKTKDGLQQYRCIIGGLKDDNKMRSYDFTSDLRKYIDMFH